MPVSTQQLSYRVILVSNLRSILVRFAPKKGNSWADDWMGETSPKGKIFAHYLLH